MFSLLSQQTQMVPQSMYIYMQILYAKECNNCHEISITKLKKGLPVITDIIMPALR